MSVSRTGGNWRVNLAMSRSPSASSMASRNVGSSGQGVSALGMRPRASCAFQSAMPSAQRRRESTLFAVDGRRRSIGRRSGGIEPSAFAWPPASSAPRLRSAFARARASSASSRRFARMPRASTTASGSASGSRRSSAFARSVVPPRAPPSAEPETEGAGDEGGEDDERGEDDEGGEAPRSSSSSSSSRHDRLEGARANTRHPERRRRARSDGTRRRAGSDAREAVDAIAERVMRGTTRARRRAMCARRASDRGAPPGEDRANDRRE